MKLRKFIVIACGFIVVALGSGASVFALLNQTSPVAIVSESEQTRLASPVQALPERIVVQTPRMDGKSRIKEDDQKPGNMTQVDRATGNLFDDTTVDEPLPGVNVVLIEDEANGESEQTLSTPVLPAPDFADSLETRFETEQYDPAWNDPLQTPLRRVFGETSVFAGNELVEARCQSTLCRVEIRHHEASARDQLLLSFVSEAGSLPADMNEFFEYGIDAEDSNDGIARTVVFVARPGHPLQTGTEAAKPPG